MKPADNLTASQAIEPIRQLLKLSGCRGSDNNWILAEIAKHVANFTSLSASWLCPECGETIPGGMKHTCLSL